LKLIYLFPNSFVEKSANRIQATNFAYALFSQSDEGKFFFITGDNYTKENLEKVGIKMKNKNHIEIKFRFKRLKTIQYLLKIFQLKIIDKDSIFYIRDYLLLKLLYLLSKLGIVKNKIIFELHEVPRDKYILKCLSIANKFVAISSAIKNDITKVMDINENDILVAHDGFRYENTLLKNNSDVDDILKLLDEDTIVYIGTYQEWKNIEFIIEIAKILKDIKFILIGVDKSKVKNYNRDIFNVYFIEYVDHKYISNILDKTIYAFYSVNPNYSIAKYTSPLKLFEYLSHGITVFAPSFESINEVLTDKYNAYLYDINDVTNASQIVHEIVKNKITLDKNIVIDSIEEFSWMNRAKKVLEFAKS
jgi:glycosyltransferase involved in cell wall biosynthesis